MMATSSIFLSLKTGEPNDKSQMGIDGRIHGIAIWWVPLPHQTHCFAWHFQELQKN